MQARSWATGAYLVGPSWDPPVPGPTSEERTVEETSAANRVIPPAQGRGSVSEVRGSLLMSRPSQAGQPAALSFALGSLKKAGGNPAPVELTLLPLSESDRNAGHDPHLVIIIVFK